jgi:hypothetical protein
MIRTALPVLRFRNLAVVQELHGPPAEAASRNGLHRIGGAPVHLNEHHELLPVRSLRIFNADLPHPEQGHADPQHLACTEVAVDPDGFFQKRFELHT